MAGKQIGEALLRHGAAQEIVTAINYHMTTLPILRSYSMCCPGDSSLFFSNSAHGSTDLPDNPAQEIGERKFSNPKVVASHCLKNLQESNSGPPFLQTLS